MKTTWMFALALAVGCSSGAKPQPMEGSQDASHDRPGFATRMVDGRLWVFRAGSKELAEFEKHGELVKQVIRPGAGPGGITLKAADSDTILGYVAVKDGFVTSVQDGRLWVFRAGSKELAEFEKHGELVKQVIRPGAGPLGATIKAPDGETIAEYVVAKPGFVTMVRDGRAWVFRPGSKELEEFRKHGEPVKQVIRPGAGPGGITLRSRDRETIEAYLAAR